MAGKHNKRKEESTLTTGREGSSWETETGLPNDVDGWVTNPRFGFKDEYLTKVKEAMAVEGAVPSEGAMFMIDLVDAAGELVGSPGYSIGSGWIISDDGMEITHPKRKNVVGTSMYGKLMNRARRELGVPMEKYGFPTRAESWNGLGFHWMQEEHPTVGGPPATGLMPVEFLGEKKPSALGAVPATGVPVEVKKLSELELELRELAQSNPIQAFQLAAIKKPEVTGNDELMASILDDGPNGFWAKAQK